MEAYVLTQMELVGEGEQSHVVTRNKGVTFDPEKAAAWARKGVDYDYDTLPFSEDEAINAACEEDGENKHDAHENFHCCPSMSEIMFLAWSVISRSASQSRFASVATSSKILAASFA